MKVDINKNQTFFGNPLPECQQLIDKILSCTYAELPILLTSISSEQPVALLSRTLMTDWVGVLDFLDGFLANVTARDNEKRWEMRLDANPELQHVVKSVLQFLTLLLEKCQSTSAFNMIDRMQALMEASDPAIVDMALQVVCVAIQRRVSAACVVEDAEALRHRVERIARSWPAAAFGLTLVDYVKADLVVPREASSVSFDLELDKGGRWAAKASNRAVEKCLYIRDVHKMSVCSAMNDVLAMELGLPKEKLFALCHNLRSAQAITSFEGRLQSVSTLFKALQALVFLQNCKGVSELIEGSFLEQCADLLKLDDPVLFPVKRDMLNMLAMVLEVEHSCVPLALNQYCGTAYYHGFLPTMTRSCVKRLIGNAAEVDDNVEYPADFVTALFSYFFQMASSSPGTQFLIQGGIIDSMFMLISSNVGGDNLIFVTRAVRIIDMVNQIDSIAFHNMDGMFLFIHRLAVEIERSRRDLNLRAVFDVDVLAEERRPDNADGRPQMMEAVLSQESVLKSDLFEMRKLLMRCLLGFISNAIMDSVFSDVIRHIMDGNLFNCLQHIIEHHKFYGRPLFYLALNLVASFIQHEPSQLSTLQSRGLTDQILTVLSTDKLLLKGAMSVAGLLFSSLCLNDAGVTQFLNSGILTRLTHVVIDPLHIFMERSKSWGTADWICFLGTSLETLCRQQTRLCQPIVRSVVHTLQRLDDFCNVAVTDQDTYKEPMPAVQFSGDQIHKYGLDFADSHELLPVRPTRDELEDDLAQYRLLPDVQRIVVLPTWEMMRNVCKFLESFLRHRPGDQKIQMFVDSDGFKYFFHALCSPRLRFAYHSPEFCSCLGKCLITVVEYTRKTTVLDILVSSLLGVTYLEAVKVLKNACKLENRQSVLLSYLPDDWMQREDVLDQTFARPLYLLCTLFASLEEFLKFSCSMSYPETRNLIATHLVGSRLVPCITLLQRALVWEMVLLQCVDFPTKKEETAAQSSSAKEAIGDDNVSRALLTLNGISSMVSSLIEILDRVLRYLLTLSVGTMTRIVRPGYGRTNPPQFGNLLINATVVGGHLGFTSITINLLAKVPPIEAIRYAKMLLTSYKRVFFPNNDCMLQTAMVKASELGVFMNFLRQFHFVVTTDQLWSCTAGTRCMVELIDLITDYLHIINCTLNALVGYDNDDVQDRTMVRFANNFVSSITEKLYPTIVALWSRAVGDYRLEHFPFHLFMSTICHMILRGPASKETTTTPDAVEDVEMADETVRYVNSAVLQNLLDMGFERHVAVDAVLSTDNVLQAADYCIMRSRAERLQHVAPAKSIAGPEDYPQMLRRELILNSSLRLLSTHPHLIYRIVDLLSVTIKTSSYEMLLPTFEQIRDTALVAIESLWADFSQPMTPVTYEKAMQGSAGRTLYLQLHVISLLIEEFRAPMASFFFESTYNMLAKLTSLLELVVPEMERHAADAWQPSPGGKPPASSWICTFLLAVELAERETSLLKWHSLLPSYTDLNWYYFDRKWVAFDARLGRRIGSAFATCERQLKITLNGQRQTVDFAKMTVTNADGSAERFVMFLPVLADADNTQQQQQSPPPLPPFNPRFKVPVADVVGDDLRRRLFEQCIRLICPKLVSDTLHAVLKLCLRYTRDHDMALAFLERDGVARLLNIRTCQSFASLYTTVSLLIRHILEDKDTLHYLTELGLRSFYVSLFKRCSPAESRDFNFVMRSCERLACRQPDVFVRSMCTVFRLKTAYPPVADNADDQKRWSSTVLTVAVNDDTSLGQSPPLTDGARRVIGMLLDYLLEGGDMDTAGPKPTAKGSAPVYKSAVLHVLAELAFSFPEVATFVVNYRYAAKRDCSVLAFMLDNLLTADHVTPGDSDCSTAVKSFVCSFCNARNVQHMPVVVSEIRDALHRTLTAQPATSHRYVRLCSFAQVLLLLKATCEKVDQAADSGGRCCMSTLIKAIMDCKLLSELADVVHYLPMSDQRTIDTVNVLLCPLEAVVRYMFCHRAAVRSTPFRLPRVPAASEQQQQQPSGADHQTAAVTSQQQQQDGATTSMEQSAAVTVVAAIPASVVEAAIGHQSTPTTPDQRQLVDDSQADAGHSQDDTFTEEEEEDEEDDEDVLAADNSMFEMEIDEDEEGDELEEAEDDEEDEEEEEEEEEDDVHEHHENHAVVEGDDGEEIGEEDEEEEDDDDDEESDERHVANFAADVIAVDAADLERRLGSANGVTNNVMEFVLSEEDLADTVVMEHINSRMRTMVAQAFLGGVVDSLPTTTTTANSNLVNTTSFTGLVPVRLARSLHSRLSNRGNTVVAVAAAAAAAANTVPLGYVHPLLIRHAESPANGLVYGVQHAARPDLATTRAVARRVELYDMGSDDIAAGWYAGMSDFGPLTTARSRRRTRRGGSQSSMRHDHHHAMPSLRSGSSSSSQSSRSQTPLADGQSGGTFPELDDIARHGVFILDTVARWTIEAAVLDGPYALFAVLSVRRSILEQLGRQYDTEMAELRAKRQAEEDEQLKRVAQQVAAAAAAAAASAPAQQEQDEEEAMQTSTAALASASAPTAETAAAANGEDLNGSMESLLTAITESVESVIATENSMQTEVSTAPSEAMSTAEEMVHSQEPPTAPVADEEEEAADDDDEPSGPPGVVVVGQRITDPQLRAVLGDLELPEGVDPVFLAELPDEIRQEVVAEQVQLLRHQRQRLQQQQQQQETVPAAAAGADEISADFLVALPPELQAEVLTQQRMARQRVGGQTAAAAATATVHVEYGNFFDTLPRELREQILSDADESQLADLPPELTAEARRLREARTSRISDSLLASWATFTRGHHRLFQHASAGRLAAAAATSGGGRHAIRSRQRHARATALLVSAANGMRNMVANGSTQQPVAGSAVEGGAPAGAEPSAVPGAVRCFSVLDKQSLSCLLIALFCNDRPSSLNRTHRVLKFLSFDSATRDWLSRALISMLKRAERSATDWVPQASSLKSDSAGRWLQVTMSNEVGCRVDVFQQLQQPPHRMSTRRSGGGGGGGAAGAGGVLIINPLIVNRVCADVLQSLLAIAKAFPVSFFPDWVINKKGGGGGTAARQQQQQEGGQEAWSTDFWDILAKLDDTSLVSGCTAQQRRLDAGMPEVSRYGSMEESLFGQLMLLIKHPVIGSSTSLMDSLLSVLATIAAALSSINVQQHGGGEGEVFLKEQLQCLVDMYAQCRRRNTDNSRADLDNLIIRCAVHLNAATQRCIFSMLLNGIQELCAQLSAELAQLSQELQEHLQGVADEGQQQQQSTSAGLRHTPSTSGGGGGKGVLIDRFTGSTVVVSAGPVTKNVRVALPTKELQCPSMMKISVKNSTQTCLLRLVNLFLRLKRRVVEGTFGRSSRQAPAAADQTAAALPAPAAAAAVQQLLETMCSTIKEHAVWDDLSASLSALGRIPDPYTVLVLQPAVEAFVTLYADSAVAISEVGNLMHASTAARPDADVPMDTTTSSSSTTAAPAGDGPLLSQPGLQKLSVNVRKFVRFAEKHRTVFNQILRQSKQSLSSGPFRVLVNYTRILDFDIKRKYFQRELENRNESGRGEDVAIRVRRDNLFQNSYRELYRLRSSQWKSHFYIIFEGEEGQDAGGLLREWFSIITREIFNPNYALFMTSPGDRVTYMINPSSYVNRNHLEYFRFIGRLFAKAINDGMYMDCYFTRAFYKHILAKPVKYVDLESEDPSFYQSLVYLLDNPVSQLGYDLTFSLEVEEFGVRDVRDLKDNGKHILVTDDNKEEYVNLVCQMKMTGAIRQQLNAFLEGFYDLVPKELIGIFDEQELELLISGLPIIDIDDLQQNTEYHKYTKESVHIQWFWRAVRSFDVADRAKLLQFVTGTSRVPLQGFASLQGMNGVQRFQIHRDERSLDRLPTAHTCFNQMDLPPYETYEKLRQMVLLAIHECSEGFGFA